LPTGCRSSSIGFCNWPGLNENEPLVPHIRRGEVRAVFRLPQRQFRNSIGVRRQEPQPACNHWSHKRYSARDVGNLSMIRASASNFDSVFSIMMRIYASSLFRWLTVAAGGSTCFRLYEAEFPLAWQNACNLLSGAFPGPRAADRAPSGALRPINNWLNIKNQHELSFIRKTSAPFAWRFSTKGRSSRAVSRRAASQGSKENILAAADCIFWKQQTGKAALERFAQRFAAEAITTVAQT
jgi:hypothetical protein